MEAVTFAAIHGQAAMRADPFEATSNDAGCDAAIFQLIQFLFPPAVVTR